MVDTPGFNDTNRSDIDTLGVLASYLGASYANGVRIHGILMLYPISDNRMSGSNLRNIEMMKAMCGTDFYNNLAVATTMWPERPSHKETVELNNREAELLGDDRFFGSLLDGGASVFRHNENGHRDSYQETLSAQRIISHLIEQSDTNPPDPLQLQREIIDHGKTLGETGAGIIVAGELQREREKYRRELKEWETELKSQMARSDANHAQEIRELQAEAQKKLGQIEEENRALKKTMQDMHKQEERALKERIRILDKQLHDRLAEKQEELLDMEESFRAVKREMARRRSEAEMAQQEQIVVEAKTEVVQAQGSLRRFRAHTGQILNGTTNGIAAGATSGIIAAGKSDFLPSLFNKFSGKDARTDEFFSSRGWVAL